MLSQLAIDKVVGCNFQPVGALNRGITDSVEVKLAVIQVSAPELATSHRYLTVGAVSEEDRLFDWPDEELAVFTSINGDLREVVVQIDFALLQVGYLKLPSIDDAWLLNQRVSALLLEDQLLPRQLLLHDHRLGHLLDLHLGVPNHLSKGRD